tara:strand:+ start:252 stop:581 length:330 start_codon:yes stop_codon:yes gene_type:complete
METKKKRTRGPNKLTIAVRDRVEQAFNTINGPNNQGLIDLEKNHPQIFYGLVSKLIPTQATLSVTNVTIDLGAAMLEQQKTLERLNSLVDITPATPQHDNANPLITNNK